MQKGRLLLVILSMLMIVSSLFGETIRKEQVKKDGSKEFVYFTGKKNAVSVVESYDPDYYLKNVSGRVPDGEAKECYENNTLKAVEKFKGGKRYDIVKYLHNSGNRKAEIPYKDGKKEGIARIYFEDGTIRLEVTFQKDFINGTWKEYWLDGTLKTEGKIDNVLKEETVKGYSWEGHAIYEFKLKDGKYEGSPKEFNKDGSLKGTVGIINNELYVGGETVYRRLIYDAGLRRIVKESWENNAVKNEFFFNKNGFMEDVESSYFKNGKPERLRQFVSNKIVIDKQFYATGTILSIMKIKSDGSSFDAKYDRNGSVTKTKKRR